MTEAGLIEVICINRFGPGPEDAERFTAFLPAIPRKGDTIFTPQMATRFVDGVSYQLLGDGRCAEVRVHLRG